MKISIEAHIEQEIEAVWWAWNDPDCIARWNAASSDWHTTGSRVDLAFLPSHGRQGWQRRF